MPTAREQRISVMDDGGNGLLGFVIGGVMIVLAIFAFVIYGSDQAGPALVNLDLPPVDTPAGR